MVYSEAWEASRGFSTFSQEFLNQRYFENRFEYLLENFSEFATYQLEATGNFGAPDPWLFSIYGGSSTWNTFYFQGHKLNSLISPGQPLFRPFAAADSVSVNLEGFDTRWELEHGTNRLTAQLDLGGIGGKMWFADEVISAVAGYDAPPKRGHLPPTDRKKVRQILQLEQENVLPLSFGTLSFGSKAFLGQRDFLSFGLDGANGTFTESFGDAQAYAYLESPKLPNLGFLGSFKARDQNKAEFYYNTNETSRLAQGALAFFASDEKTRFHWQAGINAGFQNELTATNFVRNVFDLDGEGTSPWRPAGTSFELSEQHTLGYHPEETPLGKIIFQLQGDNGLVFETPLRAEEINALYFQRRSESAVPLSVTYYHARPFSAAQFQNELSLSWEKRFQPDLLFLTLRSALSLDGLATGSKSILRLNVEWGARVDLFPKGIFETIVSVGRKRIPFDMSLAKQIADNYYSGDTYAWNDLNNNLKFDDGEASSKLLSTTGGVSTTLASGVREPYYYYLQVPILFRFHPAWAFRIEPTYRSYRDQLWIRYRGDASAYGATSNISALSAPVFLSSGNSSYEVANMPSGLMPGDFLVSDPFYAGAVLRLEGHGKNWYLSFSFNAFLVTGVNAIGNGPVENSLGTLSEKTANPNSTAVKAVGRMDPDRGYFAKIFYSQTIFKRFDYAVEFKYRDGQPYTPYQNAVVTNGAGERQAVFLADRTHGDNIFNGDFGNREESLWEFSLRLRYRQPLARGELQFLLSMENAFDLATELQEYTLYSYETSKRSALELEIPRSLSFRVTYLY